MGDDSTRVVRKVYPRTSHAGGFAALVASPAAIQAALSEQWNSFRTRPPIRGKRDGQWTQHYYTDFPDKGWLPFQAVIAPEIPKWMAAADDLVNSFRSLDRRDKQRKHSVFTQDFSEQQWFTAAVAPSIPLWMVGIRAETNSFLPPDRLTKHRNRAFLWEFSEQHWFAAAIEPSIPLWAVGVRAETNSFRSNAREKGNNRRLLTDFQNAGWALRGAGKLYDDGIWPAIEQEPRSYRQAEQPGKREEVRSRDKLRFYTDFPESGWVNFGNIYTSDKWPAIDAQVKYDQRTAKRSNRWALWSWSNDLGWNSANIAPPFDPATGWPANEQQLRSFRAGRELDRQILQRQARYGGFGAQIFDAAIWPAIEQLGRSYELRWRKSRPWISDPDVGWLFQNLAAFDPAINAWLVEGLQTPKRKYWTGDFVELSWLFQSPLLDPAVLSWQVPATRQDALRKPRLHDEPNWIYSDIFYPERQPAIQIPADRTKSNIRWFSPDQPKTDWQFTVFDAQWLAAISQLVGERPSKGHGFFTADVPSISWLTAVTGDLYDASRYPALQQLIEWCRAGNRRYFTNENIGADWIFKALPPDVYSELEWPSIQQLLDTYRRGRELNRTWLCHQARYGGFGMPQPFDPATIDWLVKGDQTTRRRGFPEQFISKWMGGAAILDAARAYPGVLELLSSTSVRKRKQEWRHRITDPDISWIFTSLPSPTLVVAALAQLQQYRTKQRDLQPRFTTPDLAWLFASLPEFNPALRAWLIASERTVKPSKVLPFSDADVAWVFQNIAAFDPAIQSWFIGGERIIGGKHILPASDADLAWLFTSLFNPQLYVPGIDQLRSFRSSQQRVIDTRVQRPDEGTAWQAQPFYEMVAPSIDELVKSFRSEPGKTLKLAYYDWWPELGWIKVYVPEPFDPQLWAAVEQNLRSYRSPAKAGLVVGYYEWEPSIGWITVYVPAAPAVTFIMIINE